VETALASAGGGTNTDGHGLRQARPAHPFISPETQCWGPMKKYLEFPNRAAKLLFFARQCATGFRLSRVKSGVFKLKTGHQT